MRWFKHFTDALDDSFIHALMDEFGHSGYALWFMLIEIIANENGNHLTGKATLETAFLQRKLRVSRAKLEKFLSYCAAKARLTFNFSKSLCYIHIPKILDLKDNYTKDRQGSGQTLAYHKEVEVEGEVEGEEENTSGPSKLLKIQGKRNPRAEALMKLWNDTMMDVAIAKALLLTEKRKKKIALRLKDWPIEEWGKIFKKIRASDFCSGLVADAKGRTWKATFEWIIENEDNAVKVLEGKYDNPPGKGPGPKRDTALDDV